MPGPTPRRPPPPVGNNGKTTGGATGKGFKPGQSGNPSGRPKVAAEFKERCRAFVDEHVIAAWENEVRTLGEHWMKASELLAAYAYGKPTQAVEHTGADGEALSFRIERAK